MNEAWREGFLHGLRPEEPLTVSQWADKYRKLSSKASAEPGPWRTSRTPYLREPMDCLSSDSPIQRVVMMFAAQTGKALALDTPIATPTGWSTMGDLKPGDAVFDEKGCPTLVVGASPVMFDHQCYRVVFSDGAEIIADAQHLWTVDDTKDYRNVCRRTITTEEIRQTFKDGKRNRYAIPVAGALRLSAAELPIHPYALGVWLGDGNSASNQVTAHIDDAQQIADALTDCGHATVVRRPNWTKGNCLNLIIEPQQRSATHCIRGHELAVTGVYHCIKHSKPAEVCAECARQRAMHYKYGKPIDDVLPSRPTFYARLKELDLIRNKHIPAMYLRASVKQRLDLLRGLMDTDGHIDKRGKRCELAFASDRLAADAYELVVSLGLKPSLIQRTNHWRISFMAYGERAVFRLARKRQQQPDRAGRRISETFNRRIVDVVPAPSVPVRCIKVAADSSLFLAGRAMIPTHNTEAGSNWLGYVIDHAPGPMLCVQPTVEMAKRLSKQRLESMITETPCLSDKIAPPRSRDSGNTMFSKEFPGGIMLLTGANSATGLRSAPCRYLFADEVDAFPSDVDGEGDPVALAERRTTTFARRKILLTSTPTVKDFSRVESEYNRSDQRRYFVPCPSCGEMQWLKWQQLKWTEGKPGSVRYQCEHCGERFEEVNKPRMLASGEWRATAPSDGKTAGFHLSGLYSPLGWCSWEQLVDDFLRAKGDAPALKAFVNTRLSETWQEDYAASISADGLMAKRLAYEPATCPDGVVLLTSGVDVQDNRLAVSVWGWSEGETGWLIWHQELMGDPTQREVWQQLDQVLATEWSASNGKHLKITQMAIDSGGHCTHEVYGYARERTARGVVVIKGSSRRNSAAVGKGSKVDVNWKGRVIKKGVTLYMLGTDTIKTTLFGRMKHDDGPSQLRFGMAADDEYFRQLTAERQTLRYHRGFPIREWTKKAGDRNEALDCAVYAYAAMLIFSRKMNRATMWEQLRRQMEDGKPATRRRTQQPQTASGFVANW